MFDITNMGAVSVRRIRLPSETGITPHFCAIFISELEKPPSGPINKLIVLISWFIVLSMFFKFVFSSHSQGIIESDFSESILRDSKASLKFFIADISVITDLPDCFDAESAIFCQRDNFEKFLDSLGIEYWVLSEITGIIFETPNSVAFSIIKSNFLN